MKKKVALITGVTGQDGSYLAEFLLEKNYVVHGLKRRSSVFNTERIDHIYQDPNLKHRNFHLHFGDLTDTNSLLKIITKFKPDEIYNLAAQSHVAVSFDQPVYTTEVNSLGTLKFLEGIRNLNLEKKIKFYQASTSELYGDVLQSPQNELTPFNPQSPYAISKLFSYWICKNYRESYDMFICNGILFNHESKRRGETFVTRKITRALSCIAYGIEKCIYLGNLDAKRDWGHAKDYVEMQWLMLQAKKADDYVISTGIHTSVRKFVEKSCKHIGVKLKWVGKGKNEKGVVIKVDKIKAPSVKINQTIVRVDKRYYRPSEVRDLLGDSNKARQKLKWKPKIDLDALITEMMISDIKKAQSLL